MDEKKKYYWLKLQKDFFKRHDIRILEEQKNGKDYVLFYLKLLLESISHEGHLRFSEMIPYDAEMLSIVTNTNIDVVRSAIEIFRQLNLMEILDDQTIYMSETYKMIGQETKGAERKRLYRAKVEQIGTLMGQQRDIVPQSIDIEKEIDLEIDLEKKENVNKESKEKKKNSEKEKVVYGEYKNVLLTLEEYEKLKTLFPHHYNNYIEQLSTYISSKGVKYKSHYATIRMWLSKNGVVADETVEEIMDEDLAKVLYRGGQ